MDYYQGVVAEYLRRDRACFVNPEFYLQNDLSPDEIGRISHWYVDILATHFKFKCVYLCEVTYARRPSALLKRLSLWHKHWPVVKQTLVRDAHVPSDWAVRPWAFVPADRIEMITSAAPEFAPSLRITPLEKTAPWAHEWNNVLAEED